MHERLGRHGVGDHQERHGLVVQEWRQHRGQHRRRRRRGRRRWHVLPQPVLHVLARRPHSVRVEPQLVRLQFGPVSVQLQHAAVPIRLRRRHGRRRRRRGTVAPRVAARPARARNPRDGLGDDVLGERRRGLRHGDGGHDWRRDGAWATGTDASQTLVQRRVGGRVRAHAPAQPAAAAAAVASAAGAVDHGATVPVHVASAAVRRRADAREEPGELAQREPAQRQDRVPVLVHVLRAYHRLGQHIRLHQLGLRDEEAHGGGQEKGTEAQALGRQRRAGLVPAVRLSHRDDDGRLYGRWRPAAAGRAGQERQEEIAVQAEHQETVAVSADDRAQLVVVHRQPERRLQQVSAHVVGRRIRSEGARALLGC